MIFLLSNMSGHQSNNSLVKLRILLHLLNISNLHNSYIISVFLLRNITYTNLIVMWSIKIMPRPRKKSLHFLCNFAWNDQVILCFTYYLCSFYVLSLFSRGVNLVLYIEIYWVNYVEHLLTESDAFSVIWRSILPAISTHSITGVLKRSMMSLASALKAKSGMKIPWLKAW